MRAVRRVHMDVHSANTPYVKNKRVFLVTSLHEQRSDSLAQRVKALLSSNQKPDSSFRWNDNLGSISRRLVRIMHRIVATTFRQTNLQCETIA